MGEQLVVTLSDGVVALNVRATANLVSLKWLANHTSFLQKMGFPKVMPYSATARFEIGDGRVGD